MAAGIKLKVIRTRTAKMRVPGKQGASAGGGGGGTIGANYVQDTEATTWTINHNFGYQPSVQTFSVGGVEMMGEVMHLSSNVSIVNFNIAVAGTARLV